MRGRRDARLESIKQEVYRVGATRRPDVQHPYFFYALLILVSSQKPDPFFCCQIRSGGSDQRGVGRLNVGFFIDTNVDIGCPAAARSLPVAFTTRDKTALRTIRHAAELDETLAPSS